MSITYDDELYSARIEKAILLASPINDTSRAIEEILKLINEIETDHQRDIEWVEYRQCGCLGGHCR